MATALATLGLTGWTAPEPVETVLYSFKGGSDGGIPYAGLLADNQGALYGATDIGGTTNICEGNTGGCGTVFKLTPPGKGQTAWTKTVLHSFNGSDGDNPQQRLVGDQQGALYGTTFGGGENASGVAFRLTPPAKGQTQWIETVLYSFHNGGSDGSNPSGVIADKQGALYGTTEVGGSHGSGTVFKLTPPAKGQTAWTETILHSFAGGSDGAFPLSDLIFDKQGALYGTTPNGGQYGFGTVYKLTPAAKGETQWTETVLYSFKGGSDGANPIAGPIADKEGALFGTTSRGGIDACQPASGCGTVFKLTPPAYNQTDWTKTELYSFKSISDGNFPNYSLLADKQGALYGATPYGGSAGGIGGSSGNGTIFKLTPPAKGQTVWTKTVLYSFAGGTDGAYPSGGLIANHGALFGAAAAGGISDSCSGFSCGTVFELTLCGNDKDRDSNTCPAFSDKD